MAPGRPSPDATASTGAHGLLRLEVGRLRARQSRRRFDPEVHVGEPAGPRASRLLPGEHLPAYDLGLRADVTAELLREAGGRAGCAWLVRPGEPEVHDLDLEWLAAADLAFGMAGLSAPACYAVTRRGWLDVRTGDRRVWKRLRL